MIELLAGIAILGILVTIAIPGFDRAIQHQKLNNEAQQLAWDMRLARQEAITTGKATWVEFNYFANYYTVKNKEQHYFRAGISYGGIPTFPESGSRIRCNFAPSGAPSPGGSVCLTNLNQDLKYVIVNLPAGRVRISDIPPKY